MNVAVVGLWHLGTVTAACVAAAGHQVVGFDPDATLIQKLSLGELPVSEPGLAEMTTAGLDAGRLSFSADRRSIEKSRIVWVTFDTPVDEDDQADVDFVVQQVVQLFPCLAAGSVVLISSQLPVGSIRRLEELYRTACPRGSVAFACSPENARLGKAIDNFLNADRFVVGTRTLVDQLKLGELLHTFTTSIEWMSVESAEMTKHAINAFLAVSVTFINELAVLCEQVGASAREVERGLKTDQRIGPKAYLKPGAAFAGGPLARDVTYLVENCATVGLPAPLLSAVHPSNRQHKDWARRRLQEVLGPLRGKTVAVLGLTYKPGIDTMRHSSAVEICLWLHAQGTIVRVFDPAVGALPAELSNKLTLCQSSGEAVRGAEAVLVATEWPEFRELTLADLQNDPEPIPYVLDASGFLDITLGQDQQVRYITVGRAA